MYRSILSAFAAAVIVTFGAVGDAKAGLASFYGYDFAGKQTANGEIFNPNALTAASKTLPFGTLVRVTNRNNGRSVVVRINDRGPYVGNRSIDLSRAAAADIGMLGSGVASVDVVIVGSGARTLVAANSPRHHGNVQVAARSHRHHAAVQVASAGRHKHGSIQVALLKHKHHHAGTSIAVGASTNTVGFANTNN